MTNSGTKTPRLITLQQAADALTVSENTIKAFIEKGELKAINVAASAKKQYRIAISDLENFIERRTVN